MNCIATFDFGTTAVKCVIIDEKQNIIYSRGKEVTTYNDGSFIEQNPDEWYSAFTELSQGYFKENPSDNITGIIFSGQMQDVIMVDKQGNSLSNAILYNDQRGNSCLNVPDDVKKRIVKKTANDLNGSIPITKLAWLKRNKNELYNKIHKVFFSAKDYIITKLTGKFVSDVTTLSTCGIMDIKNKNYIDEVNDFDIDKEIFPKICYADDLVGLVTKQAERESGFKEGTKVYAGSGDAGATTLASGISKEGEININLGTSGWVASLSDDVREGVFNLSAINHGLYINVIPFLNAGNVHKWIANVMDGTKSKYDAVHDAICKSTANPKGLFFLPYLIGERFPVSDADIRGCYIGVNANTTKDDIIRSTLEGVAFSIKQGLLALGLTPKKISLIGGGAKEPKWNQIFADVLGNDVIVYENSEYLPSMALASVVMLEQGKISSYDSFVSNLIDNTQSTLYKVDNDANKEYEKAYLKFKKIYPTVKMLFGE